jgi:hypothetical protein
LNEQMMTEIRCMVSGVSSLLDAIRRERLAVRRPGRLNA